MAYAQALEWWAEKANLPKPDQSCLLAGSVLELQKIMEPYIPLSDDIVFDGGALPEGFLKSQTSVVTDVLPTPPTFHRKKWLHPSADPLKSLCHSRVPHEKQVKIETPPN